MPVHRSDPRIHPFALSTAQPPSSASPNSQRRTHSSSPAVAESAPSHPAKSLSSLPALPWAPAPQEPLPSSAPTRWARASLQAAALPVLQSLEQEQEPQNAGLAPELVEREAEC